MKHKATINYVVDIAIGLALLVSAITGIILLLAPSSGGYQGGRNPAFDREIIGLSRFVWKDIHNWSSLIMIAGVIGHFVLHWNWLVCMTRKFFRKPPQKDAQCAA